MDSRPLGKSVKGFPKKSLSCFQSGSKLGETSLSNCHLRCWRFFSSVSDKDPFGRLAGLPEQETKCFFSCKMTSVDTMARCNCTLYVASWKLIWENWNVLITLNVVNYSSSLCVLDKAQRIGCFFTVPPNFQYQNENWLVANQKHSFKKSSLLAQQVFSYWYRNLGGTVKNALYDVRYPRSRLLWTLKSCCTVAVFSYDQLILVRTIGWVS